MSSWAADGLKNLAPPIAALISWVWLGWACAFQGAVGAYWTAGALEVSWDSGLELFVEEFRAALGSVPLPPQKDWYQPSRTLVFRPTVLTVTLLTPCPKEVFP